MTLEAGATIKVTTDDDIKENCTSDVLWINCENITKVMVPGKRLFIKDGLVSVICKKVGDNFLIGTIENDENLDSKKGKNI